MGIRFTCPNGHPLHVKTFLAGKRGICPECETKFVIPAQSGDAASLLEEATAAEVEPPMVSPSESPPTPPPLPTATNEPHTPDVWYIRSAAGEQYGPATTEIMRGWADEGRVTPDCMVWQAGWPAWKAGSEALTLLNEAVAPAAPEPTMAVEDFLLQGSVTKRHRSSKRSRRDRARVITFALGGLVILLLVAVVLVVSRK